MGLAPSGYVKKMGEMFLCEVPVPIFSQPLSVSSALMAKFHDHGT